MTSRSRDFCHFLVVSVSESLVSEKSFGIGIGKFGLGKKVLVSVSENLVSEKKPRYRYRKIWSRKKSLGFGIDKFGLIRKVSVSVSENLVTKKNCKEKAGKSS